MYTGRREDREYNARDKLTAEIGFEWGDLFRGKFALNSLFFLLLPYSFPILLLSVCLQVECFPSPTHFLLWLFPSLFAVQRANGGWTSVFLIGLPDKSACFLHMHTGAEGKQRLSLKMCEYGQSCEVAPNFHFGLLKWGNQTKTHRAGLTDEQQLVTSCSNWKMDKDDKNPKTYVSTFRLALKPQRGKQKQNGLDTTYRTITGNNKLRCSSATGKISVNCKKKMFSFQSFFLAACKETVL